MLCPGSRREPPQLLSMHCTAAEAADGGKAAEVESTVKPPIKQEAAAESRSTTGALATRVGAKKEADPSASQYGSNSQLGSQAEPSHRMTQQLQGMLGTQASQASPVGPGESQMPSSAATVWPVSWHAEAAERAQSSRLPEPGSRAGHGPGRAVLGRICAASIGSGDVLLYSFSCGIAEAEVCAWPPAVSLPDSPNSSQPGVGRIKVTPVSRPSDHTCAKSGKAKSTPQGKSQLKRKAAMPKTSSQPADGLASGAGSAAFTWRPAGMANTFAQGLPRRVSWPLKVSEG